MNLENVLPMDIEKRSFEIITEELGQLKLDPEKESIIKRVIHTSADFDYARTLRFSEGVVEQTLEILKKGGFTIVTDTNMARTGINRSALMKLGGKAECFMSDPDVAARAKEAHSTRAAACMEKAASLEGGSTSPSAEGATAGRLSSRGACRGLEGEGLAGSWGCACLMERFRRPFSSIFSTFTVTSCPWVRKSFTSFT